MGKGQIPVEKISFLNYTGLLISSREKIVNNFRGKIFPKKSLNQPGPEPEPEPTVFATVKPTKEQAKRNQSKFCRAFLIVW